MRLNITTIYGLVLIAYGYSFSTRKIVTRYFYLLKLKNRKIEFNLTSKHNFKTLIIIMLVDCSTYRKKINLLISIVFLYYLISPSVYLFVQLEFLARFFFLPVCIVNP